MGRRRPYSNRANALEPVVATAVALESRTPICYDERII